MSEQPNPGSDAAIEQGCTCARIDNHYGAGVPWPPGEQSFWITEGCPLHDPKPTHDPDPTAG